MAPIILSKQYIGWDPDIRGGLIVLADFGDCAQRECRHKSKKEIEKRKEKNPKLFDTRSKMREKEGEWKKKM